MVKVNKDLTQPNMSISEYYGEYEIAKEEGDQVVLDEVDEIEDEVVTSTKTAIRWNKIKRTRKVNVCIILLISLAWSNLI